MSNLGLGFLLLFIFTPTSNLKSVDITLNASKYFKDDDQFRNFAKFYGKKAAAITGISAYTLRKVFNEDPKEFQQLMIEDPKLNLAVGLAITLLPNMWKTREK